MQQTPFPLDAVRAQFPALARQIGGQPVVYFDGPAGSQTPRRVAEAVSDYLLNHNANSHGAFATSRETDAMLDAAHAAAADLVGGSDPGEIAFGPNMTSLTFALSRAVARQWRPGDEVIVTRLDHDANVSPWVLAARDAGARVQFVGIREDCTLDLDDFRHKLSERTRLVAVGCASNSVGTINPVREICQWAHDAGAEVFLDAVHYAPHALLDVAAWNCDYLACSAYKFFGPHVGLVWGRRTRLESLPAYKVRPASDELPGKWMTGTQSHEGIAGALAAIEYLADLGRGALVPRASRLPLAPPTGAGMRRASQETNAGETPALQDRVPRREALAAAFGAIGRYERELAARLLAGLRELRSVKLWGIADERRLAERVPTFAITHARLAPEPLAEELARRAIFVWHGNYYALELSETLGREPEGMVRIGLLHYNTVEEVDRLLHALRELE